MSSNHLLTSCGVPGTVWAIWEHPWNCPLRCWLQWRTESKGDGSWQWGYPVKKMTFKCANTRIPPGCGAHSSHNVTGELQDPGRGEAQEESRSRGEDKGGWERLLDRGTCDGVLPLCPWGTPSCNCPTTFTAARERAYLSSHRDLELGFYCHLPGTQLSAWFPPLKDTTTLLCEDSLNSLPFI